MTLAHDIRLQAVAFLSRELSLQEFEDWLGAESWDVQLADDAEATSLAYDIERGLAELSSGDRTEEDFRRFLARLLQVSWGEFDSVRAV